MLEKIQTTYFEEMNEKVIKKKKKLVAEKS